MDRRVIPALIVVGKAAVDEALRKGVFVSFAVARRNDRIRKHWHFSEYDHRCKSCTNEDPIEGNVSV